MIDSGSGSGSCDEPAAGAAQVLLVDDDRELCQMLVEYLHADGFAVRCAHDGPSGIHAIREESPAIVVLDIMMPGMDGFETLRRLRTQTTLPVLMLTARGDEVDRIVGLELGADDYLPKPFNPRELSARLRAILRRSGAAASPGTPVQLRAGRLSLDGAARTLQLDGRALPLTSTEYAIMEVLLAEAGRVVSRDELSRRALGRRVLPFDRSLDTHVSNLRRKLGAGAGTGHGDGTDGGSLIRTVRGRGYVLVSTP